MKNTPLRILIIKPSSLGDVIHSLPFLNSLKNCFPDAKIHWVIAKGLEELLEGHTMIDKLIIINKDMWKNISRITQTIREIRELFREIRFEKYDMVIDLQGLLRSGIITAATRSQIRIGFKEAREGSTLFYNKRIETGKDIHAVDRYLKIAFALGCDIGKIEFPFPFSYNSYNIAHHSLQPNKYAVIVPGARWKTKRWPAENFGKLSSMLNLKSVVIGSKAEVRIAEKVVSCSNGQAISLAGKTSLKELIDIIKNAKFVISNDSGPMHIAAAFNIPVFAVFGPTNPFRTGPYGKGHIVIKGDVSCSPCYKKKCKDIKCLNSITAEEVYEKIKKEEIIAR